MELVILGLVFFGLIVSSSLVLCLGFVVGMAYSPIYRNGWENTGDGKSEKLGRLGIWRSLRRWLKVKFVFEDGALDDAALDDAALDDARDAPRRRGGGDGDGDDDGIGGGGGLVCVQPHGFICYPAFIALADNTAKVFSMFPGIRGAAHSLPFYIPIIREIGCMIGFIQITREVLRRRLRSGVPTAIMPGGILEMFRTRYGRIDISLDHLGALHIAYEARRAVYPVYAANVSDLWWCWHPIPRLSEWMRSRFRVGFPCFFLPVLKLPPNLYLHVGRSIKPEEHPHIESYIEAYFSGMCIMAQKYRRPHQKLYLWKNDVAFEVARGAGITGIQGMVRKILQ